MRKTDMLKFAVPAGTHSDDLRVEKVWTLPGQPGMHGGPHAPGAHHATKPGKKKGLFAKPASGAEMAARLEKNQKPIVFPPLPLDMLPLSEVVWDHAGICYKGVSKINPYRRNQDALVMEVDAATETLVLAVIDGHGEGGDKCALWCGREFPLRLFAHPAWGGDPLGAFEGVTADIAAILGDPVKAAGVFVDTEFSGCCVTLVAVRAGCLYVHHLGNGKATLGSKRSAPSLAAKGAYRGPGGTSPDVPRAPVGCQAFGGAVSVASAGRTRPRHLGLWAVDPRAAKEVRCL
jgi:hypothetical protein